MKIQKKLLALALTLAGVGWAISSAGAATTSFNSLSTNPGQGDILLGFQATGGIGVANAYLLKLTDVQTILSTSIPITFTITGQGAGSNLLADLSQNVAGQGYGSGWTDRSDLFWGIFGASVAAGGATGNSGSTYFGTRARTDINTQTTPWSALTTTPQRSGKGGPINTTGGTYNNKTSTTNNDAGIWQLANTAGGFVINAPASTTDAFNSGSSIGWQGNQFQGSFANGTAGTVLDFYRVGAAALQNQYLGYFTIDDSANVTFTPVPEPSTYALMAGAGMMFFAFARRRRTLVQHP